MTQPDPAVLRRGLDGIAEKINRADSHLEMLEHEARTFIEGDPCTVTFEPNAEGACSIYVQSVAQPPLILSVILGDAVHNLRSALDHLVWLVVLANGNTPGKWNCFPVLDLTTEFEEQVLRPRKRDKSSPLLGVDEATVTFIEGLQPYQPEYRQQPGLHGLAVLRDLSNTDKHRMVHASVLSLSNQPPIITGTGFKVLDMTLNVGPIEEGTKLGEFTRYGPTDDHVDMKTTLRVEVGFGDIQLPFSKLDELRTLVVSVLNAFGKSFRIEG